MKSPAHRAMRLSLAVGFLMLGIKITAYVLTGSAGVLGDAAESIVHMVAVMFASFSLSLADKPADHNHPYGHRKIAFFSAGLEGFLIVLAAAFILYQSVTRWIEGAAPSNLDQGLILTLLTVIINGALGFHLITQGRKAGALILVANGKHVLTDSWTSLGAVLGLALVHWTGWAPWDSICGILMAANIIYSDYTLIRESVSGLMDAADPSLAAQVDQLFQAETQTRDIRFHALRLRDAGGIHYVDVHLLYDDAILLKEAHRLATAVEKAVCEKCTVPLEITTHLECLGDHALIHPEDPLPARIAP